MSWTSTDKPGQVQVQNSSDPKEQLCKWVNLEQDKHEQVQTGSDRFRQVYMMKKLQLRSNATCWSSLSSLSSCTERSWRSVSARRVSFSYCSMTIVALFCCISSSDTSRVRSLITWFTCCPRKSAKKLWKTVFFWVCVCVLYRMGTQKDVLVSINSVKLPE